MITLSAGSLSTDSKITWNEKTYLDSNESTTNKIARISIDSAIFEGSSGSLLGTVSDSNMIISQLDKALKDKQVKGLLLNIDSPGGEVVASDEIYRKVKEVSESKPVVVYSKRIMASGAYYVAMGANYIVVNEFNISGSIGVYTELYNYDGLFEKLGIKIKRITNTNGTYKLQEQLFDDVANDPVDQSYVSSLDTVYNRFLSVIIESRGISETELKDKLAKGLTYSATDAKANNLVDEIGTEDIAINKIKELAGISNAKVIYYEEPFNLFGSFSGFSAKASLILGGENKMKVMYM